MRTAHPAGAAGAAAPPTAAAAAGTRVHWLLRPAWRPPSCGPHPVRGCAIALGVCVWGGPLALPAWAQTNPPHHLPPPTWNSCSSSTQRTMPPSLSSTLCVRGVCVCACVRLGEGGGASCVQHSRPAPTRTQLAAAWGAQACQTLRCCCHVASPSPGRAHGAHKARRRLRRLWCSVGAEGRNRAADRPGRQLLLLEECLQHRDGVVVPLMGGHAWRCRRLCARVVGCSRRPPAG